MKNFNDSPELIIVAFGLIFASIIMLASLFYNPSLSTATVIYNNKTENATISTGLTEVNETAQEQVTYYEDTNIEKSNETENIEDYAEKVNINIADTDALCTLKGIGEVKAQKIIDYRNSNGAFTSTEEIMNVSGIGEKTYEKIKNSITV